jgi:hypothetical protein
LVNRDLLDLRGIREIKEIRVLLDRKDHKVFKG